ncbi:hypothetical protein LCL96_14685 [Rossellomorea aquimaris]|uniref:hypothetical protein n=1 Tax=Rossellomorea aquimaris TaxID=189382 RepID=UPI001CD44CB7|nr:hypothetical protein [Rossellomorea aquimaris]MCA1060182.1 hypothetical protein [Rossellomorea aquimaris]
MKQKSYGYASLGMGLLMLLMVVVNFTSFDVNQGSFIQSHWGISEPIGTLVGLFWVVFFLGAALRFIWDIPLKRIMFICLLSVVGISLLPFILILLHAGEL